MLSRLVVVGALKDNVWRSYMYVVRTNIDHEFLRIHVLKHKQRFSIDTDLPYLISKEWREGETEDGRRWKKREEREKVVVVVNIHRVKLRSKRPRRKS